MPFAQRNAPIPFLVAAPGLGTRPMATGAKPLEVDVLGLLHHQPIALGAGPGQLDLVARVVCTALMGFAQSRPATSTAIRRMHDLRVDRQLLRATVPRCALAPAGLARLGAGVARLAARLLGRRIVYAAGIRCAVGLACLIRS